MMMMLRKKKNLSNRIPSSLKNALLTVAADYNGLFLTKKCNSQDYDWLNHDSLKSKFEYFFKKKLHIWLLIRPLCTDAEREEWDFE